MKAFLSWFLILAFALSAGCSKRPPQVNEANATKKKAFIAASEGKSKIIAAVLEGLKKAEYDRIDMKIEVEMQKQLALVRQNVGADGKVNADQAIAGMQKLVEFRDSERAKHRAAVDAAIERVRELVSQTDDQLAIALELDELVDKFDNAGIDMSGVRSAVSQILDVWKKQSTKAEVVPLK